MSKIVKRFSWIISLLSVCAICLCAVACSKTENSGIQSGEEEALKNTFKIISQDEAKQIMETEKDYIILDVRRPDEFIEGHIPGAICIPNETIGTEPIDRLPDKNQLILVYCRSGNRSKQAAQKLFDQGYTNIVEFGGIITWTGEIVKGD